MSVARLHSSVRLKVTLPPDTIAGLRALEVSGRYGTSISEIARYLLIRAVDDAIRSRASRSKRKRR